MPKRCNQRQGPAAHEIVVPRAGRMERGRLSLPNPSGTKFRLCRSPSPAHFAAESSRTARSRRALPMTDTLLRLIAAAAIIGLRSRPNAG